MFNRFPWIVFVCQWNPFEQAKDNVKSILGDKFLHGFVVHTDACNNACKGKEQKAVLEGSWDCWTAFILLRKGDRNKYGSLKNQLND